MAFDAARRVAGADHVSPPVAEAGARQVLAEFEARGGELAFEWDDTRDDVVVVRVRAHRPTLLGRVPFPFQVIDRTVTVRRERPR